MINLTHEFKKYQLPTDENVANDNSEEGPRPSTIKESLVPTHRVVEKSTFEKSTVEDIDFSKPPFKDELEKAYKKGKLEGISQAKRDIDHELELERQSQISSLTKEKQILVKLISDMNYYFEKVNSSMESQCLAIIVSVIFEILEKSLKNQTLIQDVLKRELSCYQENTKLNIQAASHELLEIQNLLKELKYENVNYQLDESMLPGSFNLDFGSSITQVNLINYLEQTLIQFKTLYTSQND